MGKFYFRTLDLKNSALEIIFESGAMDKEKVIDSQGRQNVMHTPLKFSLLDLNHFFLSPLQGVPGMEGAMGPLGPRGPQGPFGEPGTSGTVVDGEDGMMGPPGFKGLQGPFGDPGKIGPRGRITQPFDCLCSYLLAVEPPEVSSVKCRNIVRGTRRTL